MPEAARDPNEAAIELFGNVDRAIELAIGNRSGLASALAARGVSVVATDIIPREPSDEFRFVCDDLLDPDLAIYEAADILYARRLPEELQAPAANLADQVATPLYFTTLGFEQPIIPVERVQTAWTDWYRVG